MNLKLRSILIAAALPLTLSAQVTTTILEEDFLSARTSYVAGSSVQWFTQAGGSSVTYNSGTSIVQDNASARTVMGYFAPAGSPVTLAVGDTLTATFTVSFGANTSSGVGFRISLLDSTNVTQINNGVTGFGTVHDNNRAIADNVGTGTLFTGLNGYGALMNLQAGTGTSGLRLIERDQALTAGSLMSTAGGTFAQVGTAVDTTGAVTVGQSYTGVYSITRTESGLDLSFNFSGPGGINYTVAATDSTPSTHSFDTVGFLQGVAGGDFTVSEFKLDYTTAAIPEPSTYAVMAGLGALGLVFWRRRPHKRGV